MNPLSADLGVMRQSLLFGGLESSSRNVNRKQANLRLFEFGNCYHYVAAQKNDEEPIRAYTQEHHLGMWLTGKHIQGAWSHPDQDSSFYELKAYVDNVFARIGIQKNMTVTESSDNNIFDRALKIMNRGGKVLAEVGIVARKVLKMFDIEQPVYFADLQWDAMMKASKNNSVEFSEITKFPSVSRDLALLIDKTVEFKQIEQIARQSEKKLLKSVELFDVYEGRNLPAGKKSYAVNFILQDAQHTLNDKQIDAIMQKLIANLKKQLGAELR